MKRMLKFIMRCGVACFAVWLLFVVMVWIHLQSRLNVEWYAEGVSRILDVPRDKLILLNEPRQFSPHPIFECVENRSDVLGRCTAIVLQQADMSHLTDEDQLFVRKTMRLEYERKAAWI